MIPEETKQIILKKLNDEADANSVIVLKTQEIKQEVYQAIGESLTEAEKNLWFPSADIKVNLQKITADLRDSEQWANILDKYKEGEISTEHLVDFITLSHLSVTEEPDPIAVHERHVRDGLKSRMGVKFLGMLTDSVNKVLADNFAKIEKALPEGTKLDIQLLAPIQEKDTEDNALVKQDPEIRSLALTENILGDDFKEQILKEYFAGDIIYDKCTVYTYEELLNKLSDPDDDTFDTKRSIVVDAGMEQTEKALKRQEYTFDSTNKKFVVYTVLLSNLFDGFGGTHSDDRGVDKYVCKEDITSDQFNTLMQLIRDRYDKYLRGRTEFSEFVMGWRDKEDIRKEMVKPQYNLEAHKALSLLQEYIDLKSQDKNAHLWLNKALASLGF